MVASLLKPLTTGIQDERIAYGETFFPFAKVWQTTGRFTTQWTRLDFESNPTFGSTHFVRLLRKGHLITRLFLVAEMPNIYLQQAAAEAASVALGKTFVGPKFGWTNSLGHALLANMTMSIGNTQVEQLDSRLLEMLDEYTVPIEKTTTANRLIQRLDNGFTQSSFGRSPETTRVYVPLPFWFSRGDPGCALPIDAIQHDEVRIGVTFRGLQGLYYTDSRNVGVESEGREGLADGAALWPMGESPFYYADAAGTVVPGLRADNPKVIEVPGIRMPRLGALPLGETYILAEYVYLDQPEANRFRLSDLQIPIVQHYPIQPYPSRGLPTARIRIDIPNPTRDIYWMCQRVEAPSYNAYFLATRDLSGSGVTVAPWWPNAQGLQDNQPGFLVPGFAYRDSEPLAGVALMYEGNLVRWRTQAPAAFRSVIPSWEMKKSPWINRYFYNFSFGLWNGYTAFSRPRGEANLDKITNRELVLQFATNRGSYNPNHVHNYTVYVWAETYNLLRVYGGRAGILFAY